MTIIKRSEKILIWMHRNKIKNADIAKEADITPAAFSIQMKTDNFSDTVMNVLRSKGFKE